MTNDQLSEFLEQILATAVDLSYDPNRSQIEREYDVSLLFANAQEGAGSMLSDKFVLKSVLQGALFASWLAYSRCFGQAGRLKRLSRVRESMDERLLRFTSEQEPDSTAPERRTRMLASGFQRVNRRAIKNGSDRVPMDSP